MHMCTLVNPICAYTGKGRQLKPLMCIHFFLISNRSLKQNQNFLNCLGNHGKPDSDNIKI